MIAQNEPIKGYRIEGDEIVFSFDKRDYKKATNDVYGQKIDFEDLDINNVVVSGEFNDWSLNKWKMTKINENIYELRKNITDFTDEFSWEFKFAVNNLFWAEPSQKYMNIAQAKKNGHSLGVYNLKFYTALPDENGNATFKLNGHLNAKKVILSGSFNRWDEKIFSMYKTEEGWELKLQLNPGEYEYKFIVDGSWMEDPNNLSKKRNEFNGFNSIINIGQLVTFNLIGYNDAEKVILSGSFNDWSENSYCMDKVKNGWKFTVKLPHGKHHYKFIVDDNWIVDPRNPVKEYDNNGNINSVFIVK